jgi:hypothetical protein
MPLRANRARPKGGTGAAFGGSVSPSGRHERRGKTAAFGDQEPVSRNAEGGMVVKAPPAPSFVVAHSEFLLEFLVVALHDPAMLRQTNRVGKLGVVRQSG